MFLRSRMERAVLQGGLHDAIRTDNDSAFVAPGILTLIQLSV